MSGTAFAIWASTAGLALSWAALAANAVSPIESPAILIALFIGVFFAFVPAVWSHPKREIHSSGASTEISIGWLDMVKSAPLWSTALMVVTLGAMLATWTTLPAGETGFSVTRAALAGRPDRVRCWLTFCAAFYAISLNTALSARALRAKMGLPWLTP